MPECDGCQIPSDAVVLNQLHIVEYMDASGEIWKMDLSCDNTGNDMLPGKYFELAGWAQMMASAPVIAQIVGDQIFGEDEEEGGDGEISEVTV